MTICRLNTDTTYSAPEILSVYLRAESLKRYSAERCMRITAETLGIDLEAVRRVVEKSEVTE